jgi:hypothetical protein
MGLTSHVGLCRRDTADLTDGGDTAASIIFTTLHRGANLSRSGGNIIAPHDNGSQ